jgi:hypothetical protein
MQKIARKPNPDAPIDGRRLYAMIPDNLIQDAALLRLGPERHSSPPRSIQAGDDEPRARQSAVANLADGFAIASASIFPVPLAITYLQSRSDAAPSAPEQTSSDLPVLKRAFARWAKRRKIYLAARHARRRQEREFHRAKKELASLGDHILRDIGMQDWRRPRNAGHTNEQ